MRTIEILQKRANSRYKTWNDFNSLNLLCFNFVFVMNDENVVKIDY